MKLLWYVAVFSFLFGCASAPPPAPRVSSAAMGMDTFQVEQGMPSREIRKNQEFFFKKCSLDHPFFSKAEYSCNQGPF